MSLFHKRRIPPRRGCKLDQRTADVLLPVRLKNQNPNNLCRGRSLAQNCLLMSAIFCLILLTSCSGGGSTSAGGGIDGTGIMSAGVVSAFGSIVVNGTDFDTSEALVIINGKKVGIGDDFILANLKIGMVVTVEGWLYEDGDAVADRVIYNSNVNGPVESVGATDPITNEKEIVVLGQTVVVNFITQFEPDAYDFDSIVPNDLVEVSGYRNFDGKIRATFIQRIRGFTPRSIVEITGFVSELNTIFKTFEINGLTVNFSEIEDDLPEGLLVDNALVEVQGILEALGDVLSATEIEPGDELDGQDGDEFEIMGLVTEIISENELLEFKVGNQIVRVDPDIAEFVDGIPGDIAPGKKLEAEGSLEGGILFAWEIEFWEPDQVEVEGVVSSVISSNEFTLGEQVVETNSNTVYENLEPEEIAVGLNLEVKGIPIDIEFSVLVADKVSLEDD